MIPMKQNKESRHALIMAMALTIACILQLYGTLRYVNRLPDDTVGVTLYIVVTILFAILATVHFFRWGKLKNKAE